MTTTYAGRIGRSGIQSVIIRDTLGVRLLPLYLDICNHSPSGFAWGCSGGGPAQLSLAILTHAAGQGRAQQHYQAFKSQFVASLVPDQGWVVKASAVLDWLEVQEGLVRLECGFAQLRTEMATVQAAQPCRPVHALVQAALAGAGCASNAELRAEIIRLRCVLSDIETSVDTLDRAKAHATRALET